MSNEAQRTHIHFDGLCDVFGALGANFVARKIQARQRPDGGMDGASVSEVYIRMAWGLTGT